MYSLFSNPPRDYGGSLQEIPIRNVKNRMIEDIERIVTYYRYGTFAVKNNHILSMLIKTVGTPLSYELPQYYEATLGRALHVATSLQLTSSVNKGKWFYGNFYHECDEVLIAYTGIDKPSELAKDWRNLKPVKVLTCPVTNVGYMIPTGGVLQTERGTAVLSIDIMMLMIQYRGFMLDQYDKKSRGEIKAMQGVTHFVARYVLPNMLYSQMDQVLFNRMYALQEGAPMGKALKRHAIVVRDQTDYIDKPLMEYLEYIQHRRADYRNYLSNIPSFYSDFPLGMPDILETRQVWWALFLSRMKAMQFLIDVGGEEGIAANHLWLNKLKIDIKAFRSDGIFKAMLPTEMQLDVDHLFKQWDKLF